MKQFEYKIIISDNWSKDNRDKIDLPLLGKKGWELISVYPSEIRMQIIDAINTDSVVKKERYIFKREIFE